jgi:hypothetical protein
MKKVRVIIKNPGEIPHVTAISSALKNLQSHVGGYIEAVTYYDKSMIVLCNEEGRLKNLPPNCTVGGVDFVGTIVFIGYKGEEFDDLPIPFPEFKKTFPHLWEKGGAHENQNQ